MNLQEENAALKKRISELENELDVLTNDFYETVMEYEMLCAVIEKFEYKAKEIMGD